MKGHIRERGKGTWAVIIDLGRDENGKRRQKWHTVKGTKKDAQRELTRLLHELNTGGYVEPSKLTVAQYLEKWLTDYAKHDVAATSYERYCEVVRLHLIPALGSQQLSRLNTLQIQGYYAKALESGRRDGRGGLSARTLELHHRILRKALQQAIKWDLLVRNPCDAADPPRPVHREMQALDEEQTARLLEGAAGTRLYLPILLAVTTGLRRGEVLGLRWEDLDLKAGMLSVRQAVERVNGGVAFQQPKSAKSRRAVAIPALVVEALIKHKAAQAEHRLRLGAVWQAHDLVFPTEVGAPMHPVTLTKAFYDLVRKLDMAGLRFHDLRHSHASQLLRHGIHPKVVSERLGHSAVSVTMDTYSHVLPGLQEDAARKVDEAMRKALAPPQNPLRQSG